jgi:two-component system, OmpR family, sensor histidine kinase KdpD
MGEAKEKGVIATAGALRERLLDWLIGDGGAAGGRYWQAVGVVLVLTGVNLGIEYLLKDVEPTSLAMVYLLGVALSAARLGRWPGLLSAVLSVLAFNFTFVEPRLTFIAHDSQYLITFPVMLMVALLIGELAGRIQEQAGEARHRLSQTQALAQLADSLAGHEEPEGIARVFAHLLAQMFDAQVAVYLRTQGSEKVACAASTQAELAGDAHELAVAQWAWDQGENAGLGTQNLPGSACLHVPGDKASGNGPVVAMLPKDKGGAFDEAQLALIEACTAVLATALERARLAGETRSALVEAQAERLRGSLLSSVSHDLRTPLAVIAGTSESLLARRGEGESAEAQGLKSISEQSRRLASLVENILSVTKLQSGSVDAGLHWVPVDELVSGVLGRLPDGGRVRLVGVSGEVEVFADPLLMEQLIYNLLENALKYAPAGTPVVVEAGVADRVFRLSVSDQGPGVPEGERERVFEKFARGANAGTLPGVGLGLAICRAIASLHHGSIVCKGSVFELVLPQPPPEVADPEEESRL